MICRPCRQGGDLPTTAQDEPSRKAVEILRREFHEKCTGCECQHRVPKQ